jgi:hypothetical protein
MFDAITRFVLFGGWILALVLVVIRPRSSLRPRIALSGAVIITLVVAYAFWDRLNSDEVKQDGWTALVSYLGAFAVALYFSALRDAFIGRRSNADVEQQQQSSEAITSQPSSLGSFQLPPGSTQY